ncbi:MAG: HAMP domain-containing protein [Candidatus Tectomicrobia bacterium]|uniref:histidine kinase n=1 Tax=Tectimicrobiota bacterium TaxID=2528274 RepID=A0A932HZ70_UNCTE|nr:HAMP domain-containing protein [Candidatus Tectomicrobia bacterium]
MPPLLGERATQRFARLGLRARLLMLVGAALVPALGVILYSGLKHRATEIAGARERASHLVRAVSAGHEEAILQTRLLLDMLSRLPEVRGKDAPACSALFAGLIKRFPRYLNLGVAGPDGLIWCSGLPMAQPVDASHREYFRRAMATGGFASGGYQIGTITQRPSINFGQAYYGASPGIEGVMFAALDLAWLAGAADRVLLPPGGQFALVDREGRALARIPETQVGERLAHAPFIQRMAAEGRTVAERTGKDGVRWLTALARTGARIDGIYAVVDIPLPAALEEANRVFLRSLLALGFIALLAFAAAWAGGEWFVRRPIGSLLAGARRMAAGDLKARTGLPHEGTELNRLAGAFDRMADSLEASAKENQRNQDIVFRSEKLSTMGVLLAGATHEILNPANIIGLHAQRLIRDNAEGSMEHKSGEVMWASVQRITDICGGLRRFSRDDAPKSEPIAPSQVADDCLQLLAHKLRLASVRVEREFEDGEARVLGDRNRFMQIFLNLISNAVDAMPGSGTLTVRTSVVEEEGRRWWEGRFLDTGAGIPAEVMLKIFEPFFTTKPEDQGTGLGLPVSRQIAEAHGGRLWAESPPGMGAVFVVRFPLAEG